MEILLVTCTSKSFCRSLHYISIWVASDPFSILPVPGTGIEKVEYRPPGLFQKILFVLVLHFQIWKDIGPRCCYSQKLL